MKVHGLLVVLSGIPLFLLSFLIFPPSFDSELLLIPQWIQSDFSLLAPSNDSVIPGNNELMPLVLDNEIIVIDQTGRVIVREQAEYFVHFASDRYINTRRNHDILVIKNNYGDVIRSIDSSSFPYLFEDYSILISYDGLGLEIWDSSSAVVYSRRFASLISAVDLEVINGGYIAVVGLIDGRIIVINNDFENTVLDSHDAEVSATSIVYNVHFHRSADNTIFLISVEGHDPSYVFIREVDSGSEFRVESTNFIELPREVFSVPIIESFDSPRSLPRIYIGTDNETFLYSRRELQEISDGAKMKNALSHGNFEFLSFSNSQYSGLIIQSIHDTLLFKSLYRGDRTIAIQNAMLYFGSENLLVSYLIVEG